MKYNRAERFLPFAANRANLYGRLALRAAHLRGDVFNNFCLALAEAFMGIALLLADQGRTRQARRLYELLWRYPRYSESVLYNGIAGEKIRAQTAKLTPDDLNAIAEEAAALDIWQEAAALLDKLRTAGWEANNQQKTEN